MFGQSSESGVYPNVASFGWCRCEQLRSSGNTIRGQCSFVVVEELKETAEGVLKTAAACQLGGGIAGGICCCPERHTQSLRRRAARRLRARDFVEEHDVAR